MSLVTLIRPGQRASTARVRNSACRGYVVELDPGLKEKSRMLENLLGQVVHFRSLDGVRDALRKRGVTEATLTQYHACEEVGALGVSTGEERGVAVLRDTRPAPALLAAG